MDGSTQPKLAPPGAGLPFPELAIARVLFAVRRWRGSRDRFTSDFARERALIASLIRQVEVEAGSRRVLIPRLRGLEDSSRSWSIWMTLDHLRIVHVEIDRVITSLCRNERPSGEASTAAVKPRADIGVSAAAEYERSCDALLSTIAAQPTLETRLRFAHPWFGPLSAAGWHALAGMHMAIHRKQIERILALS